MIKLHFNVSKNYIEQQLVAGINVVENQIIDLKLDDLTSQERELLVSHCHIEPLSEEKHFYCGWFKSGSYSNITGTTSNHNAGKYGLISVDGVTIKEVIAFYKNFEIAHEYLLKEIEDKKIQKQTILSK